MGLTIERERFDPADYRRFEARLEECLTALGRLLERPGFGSGPVTVGAELELCLVDDRGRARPRNQQVRAETADPRVVLEIDRFNLQRNLASELDQALGIVRRAAAWHGGRVVVVGILATLGPGDLELAADEVALEGASTSFQPHRRVDPDRFADPFNAAQLATAPVLAAAGNSPTFLGHRLGPETRVALFKQAVDDRDAPGRSSRRVSRVAFGTGWVQGGPLELLEQRVRHHQPPLPGVGPERPLDRLGHGEGVPALAELGLPQGTVWRWNRAIDDPADGGHLQIELPALPAGPMVVDMVATAAFLLGLTLTLAGEAATLTRRLAFQQAHHNFSRAAQDGLGAELAWPSGPAGRAQTLPAPELVRQLLPAARQGLVQAGVAAEAGQLLSVIQARTASGQTGAAWQRLTLAPLEPKLGRDQALAAILERYLDLQRTSEPVHTWPPPAAGPG